MNFSIKRTKEYANALSDAGVDVHSIGVNVAGSFLGKKYLIDIFYLLKRNI